MLNMSERAGGGYDEKPMPIPQIVDGLDPMGNPDMIGGDKGWSTTSIQGPKDIPPNATWTNVARGILNPQALEEKGERFEERWDRTERRECIIVFRLLTRGEIQEFANRTDEIRQQRELRAPPGRGRLSSRASTPISNRHRSYSASRILDVGKPWPGLFENNHNGETARLERNIASYGENETSDPRPAPRRKELRRSHDNAPRFIFNQRELSNSSRQFLSHTRSASRPSTSSNIRSLEKITTDSQQERWNEGDAELHRGRRRNRPDSPTPEVETSGGSSPSIDLLWSIVDAELTSNERAGSRSSRSSYRGSVSTSQSFRAESVSTLSRAPSVASSKSSNEDAEERAKDVELAIKVNSPIPDRLRETSARPMPVPIPHQHKNVSFIPDPDLSNIPSFEKKVGTSDGSSCQRCLSSHVKCDQKRPSCSACERSGGILDCRYIIKQDGGSDGPSGTISQTVTTVARLAQLQPEATLEPENLPRGLDVCITSTVDEGIRTISPTSFLQRGRNILNVAYALGKRMARPSLREGFERVEWLCTCGDPLYVDFPTSSSPERVDRFKAKLEEQNLGENADSNSPKAAALTQPPKSPSSLSSSQRTLTGQESVSQSSCSAAIKSVASSIDLDGHRPVKQYFELCVNTNLLDIRLGEINLTRLTARGETRPVSTDAEFFQEIHKQYFQIRRRKWTTWFYKPIDIQFIHFHLFDGYRVGIFGEGKLSIPPVEEVWSGRYHYHECPLEPAEPIDKRTFLHFFWNAEKHRHSPCNIWMDRMPKKLNDSMLKQDRQNGPHMGWGVRIIEGPNKCVVASVFAASIIFSFLVSVLWAVGMRTEESGFGIGQWMMAALTAGFSAFYFHLAEG